jgi:transcriptional regulator with XRE-family HTH domain
MQTPMLSENRARLNIAENLHALMVDGSLSQTELSKRAGISQSFVHKLLNAKATPSAVTLRNLAESLGVSTDRLIDNPPERFP